MEDCPEGLRSSLSTISWGRSKSEIRFIWMIMNSLPGSR